MNPNPSKFWVSSISDFASLASLLSLVCADTERAARP
jgi:hypothetical protein